MISNGPMHNSGTRCLDVAARRIMILSSVVGCLGLLYSVSAVSQKPQEGSCDAGSNMDGNGSCPSVADDAASSVAVPCDVYMAPSTLGNNSNMGIYTAKDLTTGDVVQYPEIAIPLLFRDFDTHPPYANSDGQLWDRYIWEGYVADIETYDDTDREACKCVFVPGVGCTVNSIMDMKNIESTHGSIYSTAGLSRANDPGSGAFSPYHSSKTVALVDIPAGSELFAEYGDSWIPFIPGAAVTLNKYLDEAEEFLDEYWEWYQQLNGRYGSLSMFPDLAEGLWDLASHSFPLNSRIFSVLPRTGWKTVKEKLSERDEQVKSSGKDSDFSVIGDSIRKTGTRSLEWLQENGKCQDHIVPGRSTIYQAGRGAFASRPLPKGTVVGYAPLIHIGEKAVDILTMTYNDGDGQYTKLDLVINYSFGHSNSTLILTPYGAMVNYINHDRERANVMVQWPEGEMVAHKPEWLTKDIKFLRNTIEKIGLSFDYVALRDIEEGVWLHRLSALFIVLRTDCFQFVSYRCSSFSAFLYLEGEEIFLDYGPEWEAAWSEHVKNWKPPADADLYKHSSEYKLEYFLTVEELKTTPYPPNLHTMCYESYHKNRNTGTYEFLPVLRKDKHRVYCNVLMRRQEDLPAGSDPEYTYTVELRTEGVDTEGIVVHKYKSDAIFLYDRAFSSDWHLRNSFRHTIMVPDDVFPETWKNLL